MRRLFLLVGLVLGWGLTPNGAIALWAELSDAELIARSDLIVTGEFLGRTEVIVMPGRAPRSLGVVKVEEVLKGEADRTVVLLAVPSPTGLRSSTDISYRVGQRGLWYLRLRKPEETGIFLADHPRRFVPMADAEERIDALRDLRNR